MALLLLGELLAVVLSSAISDRSGDTGLISYMMEVPQEEPKRTRSGISHQVLCQKLLDTTDPLREFRGFWSTITTLENVKIEI
jgi:hypothetical protein